MFPLPTPAMMMPLAPLATEQSFVPVGLAVGLPPYLLAKIGKLLLNHSFMVPGLVTVIVSVVIALSLGKLLLH